MDRQKYKMWDYLHHCLTDIVLDKTIASTDGVGRLVVKARLFLKLTSHLFTEDTELYRLCKGLNRRELKSLSLRACERQ